MITLKIDGIQVKAKKSGQWDAYGKKGYWVYGQDSSISHHTLPVGIKPGDKFRTGGHDYEVK